MTNNLLHSRSVVFIHGLTGHPKNTWTAFSTSPDGSPSEVFWPYDLLPQRFPDIRILTYGFNLGPSLPHLRHPILNIDDVAMQFLELLSNHRELWPDRALLFIAHSLGGNVLKKVGLPRPTIYHMGQTLMCQISDSSTLVHNATL